MVAGQNFTHYLESFGNGLEKPQDRRRRKSLFQAAFPEISLDLRKRETETELSLR